MSLIPVGRVKIVKESTKAILIETDEWLQSQNRYRSAWLPKSQIRCDRLTGDLEGEAMVYVPGWLGREKLLTR